MTDLLVAVVIALIGVISGLVVWIFNDHKQRVDGKFKENAEEHKEINTSIKGVSGRVDHIIKYHEGIPEYDD